MIDIHGDTAKTVLGFRHNKTDREKLVYVSSAISRDIQTPDDTIYTPVINFFEVPKNISIEEKDIYANEIAEDIAELLQSEANSYNSLSINMAMLLKPTIFTVMCSPNPSLQTLADFFNENLNSSLVALGQQSPIAMYSSFFRNDWSSSQLSMSKAAIRNKLMFYNADPVLSRLINGRSTINIEYCLQQGKQLIFHLPLSASSFSSRVLSRLVVATIQAIMMRRDSVPRKERVPCYLFLDEFQEFATKSMMQQNLAQSRKWGLRCIMATQTVDSLEKNMKTAVLVNTNVKMVGLLNHEGQRAFSKELDVPIETLKNLQPMQFVCRKQDGKHTAFTYRVPILGRQYMLSEKEQQELINYMAFSSGYYVPLSTSPAPPTPLNENIDEVKKNVPVKKINTTSSNEVKPNKKNTADDLFDDDWKPRFNQ